MKIAASLLLFCLITAFIGTGQNEPVLLDSLFSTMHSRGQFNGNVLIAEDFKVIFNESYGYANHDKNILLDQNTLFNTGSVSKAFTAVAILQLAEQDKLNLSDKVSEYLDTFPYPDITIHQLLIHAGGLPFGDNLESELEKDKIASNDELLRILYHEKPPLLYTPGERSEYSNLGYVLLAEVVEKVSGENFKKYVSSHIFEKAGMKRTGIYDAVEIQTVYNAARGQVLYPFTGRFEEALQVPEYRGHYVSSGFVGDGNVWSTTVDLFNFYKALADGKLLSEKSVDLLFQKHIPAHLEGTPDYGNSYGYGWTIINAPIKMVHRGGGLPGFVSNTIWNITDNRLIIYLMNDYLEYTSYQQTIPVAIGMIYRQNQVQVPKLIASIELTKRVVVSSADSLEKEILEMKASPDLYEIDLNGLKFLAMKLKELGHEEKARLIINSFGP